MNQIEKILEISSEADIRSGISNLSNPIGKIMLDSVQVHNRIKLKDVIGMVQDERGRRRRVGDDVIDFMKHLLAFDPRMRYSSEMALSHAYLSDFHNPTYEQTYQGGVMDKNALDDNTRHSVDRYRLELEEMKGYKLQ